MPAIMWHQATAIESTSYTCGYCGKLVGTDRGFRNTSSVSPPLIAVCPFCASPTFIDTNGRQWPGTAYGNAVEHVPESVHSLYDEARRCYSVTAYTSVTLACRKLLMVLAAQQGASEGQRFVDYVDFLANEGYVPPNGKVWVDRIRQIGNEATHELGVKTADEAEALLSFVEMLLKFIYEFPAKAQP